MISRAEAFRFWLKLGFISFGGPAGQIAIMHRELVEQRRWISEKRFLHALNYCMVLPGPEAQQLATYLGWLMHGTWGGVVAGTLFLLPSLAILIALSWAYALYSQLPVAAGVLAGIKPAVVALVFFAAWRIGKRTLRNGWLGGIAFGALTALTAGVAFPWIVLGAALAGMLVSRIAPSAFSGAAHGTAGATVPHAPAIIDDTTPTPPHARYSHTRLMMTTGVFIALWCAAFGLTSSLEGSFSTMARFFTQAALLTFGGAYAVLPYVFQGAVEQHQWLSAAQMIDGLALGETTPGPLIMIVAYIGFLGGWAANHAWQAAILGACVATFFTFLPSFLFILAGAPLIETTRDAIKVVAPMTAITAAVVGVIVHLGGVFAWHVWWPATANASNSLTGEGFADGLDVFAVLISIGAGYALVRHDIGIVKLIAAAALLGTTRALLQVAL
jgi:chromate transporter